MCVESVGVEHAKAVETHTHTSIMRQHLIALNILITIQNLEDLYFQFHRFIDPVLFHAQVIL